MNILFFINSCLLGFGVAIDAFVVATANGISEKNLSKQKAFFIAVLFGFFQGFMPYIGYLAGSVIFGKIIGFIPYLSLVILSFLGVRTLLSNTETSINSKLTYKIIFMQAIATSIDALSVGFTLLEYTKSTTFICVLIISVITFLLCLIGIYIGKKFGSKFNKYASIISGIILILIGIEIFFSHFFSV